MGDREGNPREPMWKQRASDQAVSHARNKIKAINKNRPIREARVDFMGLVLFRIRLDAVLGRSELAIRLR